VLVHFSLFSSEWEVYFFITFLLWAIFYFAFSMWQTFFFLTPFLFIGIINLISLSFQIACDKCKKKLWSFSSCLGTYRTRCYISYEPNSKNLFLWGKKLIKKKGCARIVASNLFLHFDKIFYRKKTALPTLPFPLVPSFYFYFFGRSV
jgi:hypothetical protein